jgi:CRP-like cAMP-binding protein
VRIISGTALKLLGRERAQQPTAADRASRRSLSPLGPQLNSIADAPDGTLEPFVRRLGYWRKLSADDRAALLGMKHTVRTVEAHQFIVREFDRTTQCCVLLSGYAVRHKIVAGGARQIVAIHMKGENIDLQNAMLGKADHSVQMLTSGKVAMIPAEEIDRVAFERPDVGRALWTDTLVDASIFREWIANVGRRDARMRIAHILCEFSLRLKVAGLGETSNYELPMTQEQLADATGLTPVHVNRTIKQLDREGLIERTSARSIIIGDWRKLASEGDFQSAYLHLNEAEPAVHA